MRPTLAAVATLALAAACSAQTINIDFGAAGIPDPAYAAAGQPGYWNAIDSVTIIPQRLNGADGQPTGVTIAGNFVDIGPSVHFEDDRTLGDDGALLDDYLPGPGDVVIGFRLDGLAPGEYDVIVYGWGPGQHAPGPLGFEGTCIDIFEEPETGPFTTGCIAGPWNGGFVEGETHFATRLATTGTIHVQYFGSYWGAAGFLNGLQVAPVGGGASCLCDVNNDNSTDVFDLLTYLDGWFAGDADINADNVTDVHDLLAWLDCFFAGC